MSAYCPPSCFTEDLIKLPDAFCPPENQRGFCIKRIVLFKCSYTLPTPLDCDALNTAYLAGEWTTTGQITQVELGEPSLSTLDTSECQPDVENVVGRELTFRDYSFEDLDEADLPSPFFERVRIQNLMNKRSKFYVGYVTCDNQLFIAKDKFGNPLSCVLLAYVGIEKQNNNGFKNCYQYFNWKIRFNGDPFTSQPVLDLNDCDLLLAPAVQYLIA